MLKGRLDIVHSLRYCNVHAIVEPGYLDGSIYTASDAARPVPLKSSCARLERHDPAAKLCGTLPHGIRDPWTNGVAFLFQEY
jgi:hypothetical protein